jgi:hypothetical protein
MLNDKNRSDMEQAQALLAEVLPSTWVQLFRSLVKQDMAENDALYLVGKYIMATCGSRKD